MANVAGIIAFFVALACLVHAQAVVVKIKSDTIVKDGNNSSIAKLSVNATLSGGGNSSKNMDIINTFVESQITKLLKNPDRYAVKNYFGRPAPPPPQPALAQLFNLHAFVKVTVGTKWANLTVDVSLETRGHGPHGKSVLNALKGPAFFAS